MYIEQKEADISYLEVVSDGTIGPIWVQRFEKAGYYISKETKEILCSDVFVPTHGVKTRIAILKPGVFIKNDNIRKIAGAHNCKAPSLEVSCLLRWTLSDAKLKALGLVWVIIMHQPIKGLEFSITNSPNRRIKEFAHYDKNIAFGRGEGGKKIWATFSPVAYHHSKDYSFAFEIK